MLNVQLTEADWIKLLNYLANYSFKQVAPLIQSIQQQLSPQLQPQQLRPNGRDDQPEARVN